MTDVKLLWTEWTIFHKENPVYFMLHKIVHLYHYSIFYIKFQRMIKFSVWILRLISHLRRIPSQSLWFGVIWENTHPCCCGVYLLLKTSRSSSKVSKTVSNKTAQVNVYFISFFFTFFQKTLTGSWGGVKERTQKLLVDVWSSKMLKGTKKPKILLSKGVNTRVLETYLRLYCVNNIVIK